MDRRLSIYATGLAIGLLAHFSGTIAAMWVIGQDQGRPEWRVPGLIVPLAATAALLWLNPHRITYAVGVGLLIIGLAGWPVGWVALLLPVAWVVLAHSVSHWLVGFMAYSIAGFAYFLIWIIGLIVLGSPLHLDVQRTINLLLTFVLFWPIVSLWMLGAIDWVTPLIGGQ